MENVKERVIELVANRSGVPASEITTESTWSDLNVDSLDVIELMMGVETEFGVVIPDSDMEKLPNVGMVIEYLEGFNERIIESDEK